MDYSTKRSVRPADSVFLLSLSGVQAMDNLDWVLIGYSTRSCESSSSDISRPDRQPDDTMPMDLRMRRGMILHAGPEGLHTLSEALDPNA